MALGVRRRTVTGVTPSPAAPTGSARFPIVALVGSAGGLDAVTRILSRLPTSFGAAVVVLIHVPPQRISHLVEVIGRTSSLPVVGAEDDLPLQPGQVIVVPPGTHLLIAPDAETPRAILVTSGAYPPSRPSADLLLATLATAVGGRAIAVILSGGGHDGATGATVVHVCGGTVLATDETSSQTYSMPLSAIRRDEAVDRVLPLDAIAEALTDLVAVSREGLPASAL
jgi:two-component system chemotaxis response regulator CheB